MSYGMSHAEYAEYIDPSNEAGKLLMTHTSALQLIMAPITADQNSKNRIPQNATSSADSSSRWLRWCHSRISEGMREYYEWTLSIERGVEEGTIPLKFETQSFPRLTEVVDEI